VIGLAYLSGTRRDRLLHHAHLVLAEGGSPRLPEAVAGKGVKPLT